MKIDLFLSRREIQPDVIKERLAVIIDVLRASTSIITALANGCEGIIPTSEIEEAKRIAKKFSPHSVLLAGERNEMPIPGFDLSNSPLEYTANRVAGKKIIFTSNNGSKLFDYISFAQKTVVAGFVNVTMLSDFIVQNRSDIVILCAGKNEQFGMEDAVCGGMIIDKIANATTSSLILNDGAMAAQTLYQCHARNITAMLYQTSHGKRLIELGHHEDITTCGQIDSVEIIPILSQNKLVSFRMGDKIII